MKLLKSSIFALIAFATAALTGCSDTDDYSLGSASPGAYFPEGLTTAVKASTKQSVYELKVCRTSTDADATYAVSSTIYPATDEISIPSSVSFADGELETTLPITYNPDAISKSDVYDMIVSLDNASNYGYAEHQFTFQLQAPTQRVVWDGSVPEGTSSDGTTWPAVEGTCTGTGTFYYNCLDLGTDPGLAIYKVYDPEEPHTYDLEITPWYADDVTLTINVPDDRVRNEYGEVIVRVPEVNTTDTYGSYGDIYMSDLETYVNNGNFASASSFDATAGKFYLATVYYVSAGILGYSEDSSLLDIFQLDGYPDYTVAVEYTGVFTNTSKETFAVGSFTTGADVASVKAALVATSSASEALQYVLQGGDDVLSVATGTDVSAMFPVSDSGSYILAAVSYDASGTAQLSDYATVKIDLSAGSDDNTSDAADWKSLGTGEVVDGWVLPNFLKEGYDYTSLAYAVEIQQSKTDENLYRLVAPFNTEEYLLVQAGYNDFSGSRNVEFSIEPMDGSYFVSMRPQLSGFYFSQFASEEIAVANMEGYYVNSYEEKGEDLDTAKLLAYLEQEGEASTYDAEDGLVTLTTPLIGVGSKYYYAEVCYIAFPTSSQAARHKARAKSVAKPRIHGITKSIKAKRQAAPAKSHGKKVKFVTPSKKQISASLNTRVALRK